MHNPFQIFATLAILLIALGALPFLRYAWLYFFSDALIGNHIQSLLLGTVLLIVGVLLAILGMLANLIKINRKLLEDIIERQRKQEFTDKD